ncbi:hypothetical protein AAFF_G00432920 [Aldrovandia affinis]|uniref:Uncharacterized protein n=1 Tax=Aldrovandia affinis TaxID=143900 RepID=A0AAD7S8J8_9TELE|nr:hypothetical protein AAFF_G00432920 [Aldrovandia affinis]
MNSQPSPSWQGGRGGRAAGRGSQRRRRQSCRQDRDHGRAAAVNTLPLTFLCFCPDTSAASCPPLLSGWTWCFRNSECFLLLHVSQPSPSWQGGRAGERLAEAARDGGGRAVARTAVTAGGCSEHPATDLSARLRARSLAAKPAQQPDVPIFRGFSAVPPQQKRTSPAAWRIPNGVT